MRRVGSVERGNCNYPFAAYGLGFVGGLDAAGGLPGRTGNGGEACAIPSVEEGAVPNAAGSDSWAPIPTEVTCGFADEVKRLPVAGGGKVAEPGLL